MQLIVPFAGVSSEAGRHTASHLSLPRLEQLLARATVGTPLGGDERSLSAPHELALAQALHWPLADGLLPWAARAARRDGLTLGTETLGLLTPVHLHLGTEQVTLTDPAQLALAADDARTLFDALQALFRDDGFALHWGDTQRWYVAHASLATLATASLDRVIGRNIDPWLPEGRHAATWRRLQSEAQMLLHGHAVNAQREAAGLLAVNSVWLSGCGSAHDAPLTNADEPRVDDRLRAPALAEDWAAWADAWHALDRGPLAELQQMNGTRVLTLAGERRAVPYTLGTPTAWQRLRSAWRREPAHAVLQDL
jgi:hypothetical protein